MASKSASQKALDVDSLLSESTVHQGDGAEEAVEAPLGILQATIPQELREDTQLDDPELFFNRELSWLDFNWRVFAQALDERIPLLERVRFIAITANNLDEFYQKRVGGL
ncbi:MAG: hypothetical protein R3284_06950, partial [Rubricoccaceae bacterium]|nr:hypothetical protein [Rubricoccaceae bacterium]